jgi:hypothetical protein
MLNSAVSALLKVAAQCLISVRNYYQHEHGSACDEACILNSMLETLHKSWGVRPWENN